MGTHNISPPRPDDKLLELQAIRDELAAIRALLDEFCGVLLNTRFPYGKPDDRWRRPHWRRQ